MTQVTVLTHIVTPYQVELFDALQRKGSLNVRVIYLADSRPHRDWHHPKLNHDALQMASASAAEHAEAEGWVRDCDLLVVGHYRNEQALRWIDDRQAGAKPWCFWGERPGFRFGGLAGRAFRAWKLRSLLRSKAPIWGIGEWAVDGWRQEFGQGRKYFNVPYFSDLGRFTDCARVRHASGTHRRILFSGSLIPRKGVDLLAAAFAQLAPSRPSLTLDVIGSGNLHERLKKILGPVADRVKLHGFRQWSELPWHYAQADVLCVPSRYDGWGLVVPEGLAAGLPVIATDKMGAAVELMKAGESGWIAKAGDLGSVRDSLEAAADASEATIRRMSEKALQSVTGHQLSDGVLRFERAAMETLDAWAGPFGATEKGRDREVKTLVH